MQDGAMPIRVPLVAPREGLEYRSPGHGHSIGLWALPILHAGYCWITY